MRILIVGAGPAGCYTAQLLKKQGYNPVIIEEHPKLGRPVHCAGIVSSGFFDQIESLIPAEAVKSRVNKFSINTPWEDPFSINKKGVAILLDREKFDISLGEGLEIHLGQRANTIIQNNNSIIVQTEQREVYEADILIGADGADSLVRKYLLQTLYSNKKEEDVDYRLEYYFGLQYRVNPHDSDKLFGYGEIKVFFNELIPFFIWIIPENDNSLRIGLLAENGKKVLNNFMKEKGLEGEIEEIFTGKIPIGYIPTSTDRIALVGDAACQIKPLTGGGLSFGLQSAQILADCIREHNLEKYDFKWKRKFGQEIKFGLKARKIYESLEQTQRKELFRIFKRNSDFIEEVVDYDSHYKLFREAFHRPNIVLDAGKLFRFYLEDLVKENIKSKIIKE